MMRGAEVTNSGASSLRLKWLAGPRISQFDPSMAVRQILAEPEVDKIANEGRTEKVNRLLEAFGQPWRRASAIYLPCGTNLVQRINEMEAGLIAMYKGFSLDPNLMQSGERVDIADSIGMFRIINLAYPRIRLIGMMADGCWAVNTTAVQCDPELQGLRYSQGLAAVIIRRLICKLRSTPEGRAIREAAAVRVDFLRRIFSLTGNADLLVLSSDLWERDFDRYAICLQKAIEFCMQRADGKKEPVREGDQITLRGPNYRRYNTDFQRLYVPFVLAEAIYLEQAYRARIALCPTSERGFSRILGKFARANASDSLGDMWFERPPDVVLDCMEGCAPISRITFRDGPAAVRAKLEADLYYAAWMGEVIEPFVPGSLPQPGAGMSIYSLAVRISEFIEMVNRL